MPFDKLYHVYILSNKANTVVYIGVTGDLIRRLWEHRNDVADEFTKRYHVHKLVYYESTTDAQTAIDREKQLKKVATRQKERIDRKRQSCLEGPGGRLVHLRSLVNS